MNNQNKYFLLNKENDFLQGSQKNIRYLSPGITVNKIEEKDGWYFTKIFDTQEKGTDWHRMTIDGQTISQASITMYIYTSDILSIIDGGDVRNINEVLNDKTLDIEEKQTIFKDNLRLQLLEPKDVLLHKVSGRYLWILIHLKVQGEKVPVISKIKLYFPKVSWLKYLPDLYQENIKSAYFLERYLEIFETLYMDITNKVNQIPEYFDPDSAKGEFLKWLAEWVSVEDRYLWTEEKLRYLVKNSIRLYQIRGTRAYIEEMIELYTGTRPYIVEYHQLQEFLDDKDVADRLEKLYGDNSYLFSLIVNVGRKINNRDYQILMKIINNSKPAYMGCNLIVLEPYIYLDKYSYLGVNSVLGNYTNLVLDGQSSISFTKLDKVKN